MTAKGDYFARMAEWSGYRSAYVVAQGLSSENALAATYYDGTLCELLLADHFTDTATYNPRAVQQFTAYAVNYGVVNSWALPGYWAFGEGLAEMHERSLSANALTYLQNLCASAAYHASGSLSATPALRHELSREWSYVVMNLLQLKRVDSLSGAQQTRLDACYADLLTICADWSGEIASYCRPFMVGIAAHALVNFYELEASAGEKAAILTALQNVATYIWDTCWDADGQAFNYTDRDIGQAEDLLPQPDLSMLVAPLYSWLWSVTETPAWKLKGQQIFEGAVPVYDGPWWNSGAYLGTRNADNPNGKHINQQLVWGTKYFTYDEIGSLSDEPSLPGAGSFGMMLLGCGRPAAAPASAEFNATDYGTLAHGLEFDIAAGMLNGSAAQAADGEVIATAGDSSANNYDLTQSNNTYRPICQTNEVNSHQIARFDGGDGYPLTNAISGGITKNRAGLTIALVLKPSSLASTQRLFKFDGASGGTRIYAAILTNGTVNVQARPQDAGTLEDMYTSVSYPVDTTQWWVITIKLDFSGNACKVWINDDLALNDTNIGSSGNSSNTDPSSGDDANHLFFNDYGAGGMIGDIAKFLVYNAALSDGTITSLREALYSRFNITP